MKLKSALKMIYAEGNTTQKEVARKMGVTPHTLSVITQAGNPRIAYVDEMIKTADSGAKIVIETSKGFRYELDSLPHGQGRRKKRPASEPASIKDILEKDEIIGEANVIPDETKEYEEDDIWG